MAGRPGRPEQPLNPEAGPLERLALDLRALRSRVRLTYAQMAASTRFSQSALSQAAAGQRLPSREVLLAYVRACGGDPRWWEECWERVRQELNRLEEARNADPSTSAGFGGVEATSFVGRETELARTSALLEHSRLVTLVGVGGVGKTRLAGRVVREVGERFTDGTYCAELAELGSNHAVPEAVAYAVGVHARAGQDPLTALAEALRGRRVLLVLDNCEHVLGGCARTIKGLLPLLPDLRVLATSRQPINLAAEYVLQVAPLGLPSLPQPQSAHEAPADKERALGACGVDSLAMTLFSDRAEAASPGFRVTDANRNVVAQVCRRLDGLPLALEIAARRLRTLAPEELLQRLDQRFRLLGPSAGERTAPPRHQALRALFDWSYELCTEAERTAWEQLSLCPGGVLLTDAEQLCGPAGQAAAGATGAGEAFEALFGLMDKSLLMRVETDGCTRLHMLETVRSYGQERLVENGRAQSALLRHRAWYLRLAARAGLAYGSSAQASWLRRLRVEHANLRQIATSPPPPGEPAAIVLHACLGFWLHCLTSANVGEGAGWMRSILERHPRPPSPETALLWCQAVWVAGFLLLLQGDHDGAQEVITRGEGALADAPAEKAAVAGDPADYPTSAQLTSAFLQLRALPALFAGDTETVVKFTEASLATGQWSDALLTREQCIAQLGFAAVMQGDHARSTVLLEQALEMSEARGDVWHRCYLLWALAVNYSDAGRPELALKPLKRALHHAREIDEHLGEAALSETLAWVLSSCGDPRSAAVVLGAVDRVWHPSGAPRLFGFVLLTAHRERALHSAIRLLGKIEYQQAYLEGQNLGLRGTLERAFAANRVRS
ncbi:helix-turn-helix domain-containing protein [Streptomyces sp. NBC_01285]|uniref:ATP-binding protein n=1 Tax=Streptomyces sp. NBC_01285 TaxID=2903813 RepID=UPI0022562E67|nr:helix-turn-helix domain-containing protein [Streptomyces sp. NBC_01285]MCX4773754.1 helix-turn-helix domain-containing protein [Streptomyces sp. NBC_01285]